MEREKICKRWRDVFIYDRGWRDRTQGKEKTENEKESSFVSEIARKYE